MPDTARIKAQAKVIEKVLQKIKSINSRSSVIRYSSDYCALDCLCKLLKSYFPNDERFVPFKQYKNGKSTRSLPLFLLHPSETNDFYGINDYSYNLMFAPGILAVSPSCENSVLKALTFFGNGCNNTTKWVYLLQLVNCDEIYKEEHNGSQVLTHFDDFGTKNKSAAFSTDGEVFLFHPKVTSLEQTLEELDGQYKQVAETESMPAEVEYRDLQRHVREKIELCNGIEELYEKIKVLMEKINSDFPLYKGMTEEVILDLIEAVQGSRKKDENYAGTILLLKSNLLLWIEKKEELKGLEEEIDSNVEDIDQVFANSRGEGRWNVSNRVYFGFLNSLRKLRLKNAIDIENDIKEEAKFKVLSKFEILFEKDAGHRVYTGKCFIEEHLKAVQIEE